MNDKSQPAAPAVAGGQAPPNGKARLTTEQLRAEGKTAKAAGAAKRGPGRPAGSGKVVEPEVVKAPPVDFNERVGCLFEAAGVSMGMATDCSVWLINEDQRRLLGSSFGALLADLGLDDTYIFKAGAALAVGLSVFGPKAFEYSAYTAKRRADDEKVKKGQAPAPVQPAPKAAPDPAPAAPAASGAMLHETKPGLL